MCNLLKRMQSNSRTLLDNLIEAICNQIAKVVIKYNIIYMRQTLWENCAVVIKIMHNSKVYRFILNLWSWNPGFSWMSFGVRKCAFKILGFTVHLHIHTVAMNCVYKLI